MGEGAAELRVELRRLIGDHVPPDFLGAFTDDPADLEVAQSFCRLLADRGLLCMAWPEEYGGRGASPWEQTVVREEMWAHHEPRGAQYMGVNWVGPGDHAPRHARAAGAAPPADRQRRGDLVPGLQRARRRVRPRVAADRGPPRRRRLADHGPEDVDVLRHSWPSGASCWPARRGASRSSTGITVFLVPMSSPAIEVRPIACMLGPHHLNEVFIDNLCVTEADVLGPVDGGWGVVQEVLAYERVGIARYARCRAPAQARRPACSGAAWDDLPVGAAQPLGADAHPLPPGAAARVPGDRGAARRARQPERHRGLPDRGDAPRPGERRRAHGHRRARRARATPAAARFRRAVEDHWRYAQAATVASGSIEMQRILMARALLSAA